LLYLLLHVPAHLFVWCLGSFHLKLEFQAPLYELSTKTSGIWKLFFKRTADWLRLLHRDFTVFILRLSGLLSAVHLRQLSSMRVLNFLVVSFPSVGFLPLALCGLTSNVPYFILLDGKQ